MDKGPRFISSLFMLIGILCFVTLLNPFDGSRKAVCMLELIKVYTMRGKNISNISFLEQQQMNVGFPDRVVTLFHASSSVRFAPKNLLLYTRPAKSLMSKTGGREFFIALFPTVLLWLTLVVKLELAKPWLDLAPLWLLPQEKRP